MRSPNLSIVEKIETMLFLLVYHVPVLCALDAASSLPCASAAIGPSVTVFEMLPLAALLFAGPFCELAVGLVVGRAPRRAAWSVAWLTPMFFVLHAGLRQGVDRRAPGPAIHLGEDQAVVLVASKGGGPRRARRRPAHEAAPIGCAVMTAAGCVVCAGWHRLTSAGSYCPDRADARPRG